MGDFSEKQLTIAVMMMYRKLWRLGSRLKQAQLMLGYIMSLVTRWQLSQARSFGNWAGDKV